VHSWRGQRARDGRCGFSVCLLIESKGCRGPGQALIESVRVIKLSRMDVPITSAKGDPAGKTVCDRGSGYTFKALFTGLTRRREDTLVALAQEPQDAPGMLIQQVEIGRLRRQTRGIALKDGAHGLETLELLAQRDTALKEP
jgi:hypothetical protein